MLTPIQNYALRASMTEDFAASADAVIQPYLDELAGELNAAELAGFSKVCSFAE